MKSYSSKDIIKIIKKDGWILARVEGSHYVFRHDVKNGIVVVPNPRKDLPIKTVKNIFAQAGLSID